MDIVVLAAGTSSRMGKTNKLLLDINSMPMVANTCLEALKFLETRKEKSRLVVVTGYRSSSTLKALKVCIEFVKKSSAPVEMIVVKNNDYAHGQFSSAKKGIENVQEDSNFFIQLADMPLIKAEHYSLVIPHLKDNDAVRPFCNNIPGHPVLISYKLKKEILTKPYDYSVSKILENHKVAKPSFEDNAFIKDIDTSDDLI